jgi:ribonuclease HI
MDSELVVKQMAGQYKVKSPDLAPLHRQARALLGGFPKASLRHVPRERNKGADALANKAIDEKAGM